MDHLGISTDKEVVLLYNFDFIPPPLFSEILFSHVGSGFPPNEKNSLNKEICKSSSLIGKIRYTDWEGRIICAHEFDSRR